MEKSKRIVYLDTLRGFLILTVVFGHIIELNDILNIVIYTIHMPAFFIISGMLNNQKYKNNTLKFIKRRIRALIIPYVIFCLITVIFHIIINNGITGHIKSEILYMIIGGGVGPSWFLMALFITEGIYTIINNTINKKSIKIIIIILLFIIGLYGNCMYNSFYLVPTYRILISLGFYSVGVYANIYLKKMDISNFIVLLILLIIIFLGINNGRVDLWALELNNKILYVFNSIIGSFALIYLFKNIFNKDIKILAYLGKNTLIIMGTHQILIEMIGIFTNCQRYNMGISFFIFLIVVLLEIPMIYLTNNYLPWILGRFNKKERLELS